MSEALASLRRFVRGLAAGVLRVGVLALGALAAVTALVLGLVMAMALVVWALVRGRRALPPNVFVRRGRGARASPAAEVIDVQVRELEPQVQEQAPARPAGAADAAAARLPTDRTPG
jgi:hypothetical protein